MTVNITSRLRSRFLGLFALAAIGLSASSAGLAASSCELATSGGLSFGSYNAGSAANINATGTFQYKCLGFSLPATAVVTAATGSSGTYAYRTMMNGSNTLRYQLYTDPGRTIVFATQASGGAITLNLDNLNSFRTVNFYGTVPAGQAPPPGVYNDSLNLTLTY